ncbi:hypothetical protein HPB50_015278 [Hyalomma asiaticum]|uniref:Uncharacterized protein n=1 Tax=Hyalomma asiaticum TaxID=266040 RepID=A0ACB7RLI6_HYAAI|nr:hypothetical protein HPB50_015278 [Hyalomma asiaticum]
MPTSTVGKQPRDTSPPARKRSPTKTPVKGKDQQPTSDKKQPSSPAVSPKSKKGLPLTQTPSESGPVTSAPFTEHMISEDITENKESVLIEEMLEEILEESRVLDGHDDRPNVQLNGGPEVEKPQPLRSSPPREKSPTAMKSRMSPSKSKETIQDTSLRKGTPETVGRRDVSPPKQKEPLMPHSKSRTSYKETSPISGTMLGRGDSPMKKAPSPERRDMSPPKKTIGSYDIKDVATTEVGLTLEDRSTSALRQTEPTSPKRAVSPLRKVAEVPDHNDITPSKIKPDRPDRKDLSPVRGMTEMPRYQKMPSSEQDSPGTPKGRGKSPTKQKVVPPTPAKKDLSPTRKVPGSQDGKDVRTPEDVTAPRKEAPEQEERDVFPRKDTQKDSYEWDTSYKTVPVTPEEDSAVPQKLLSGTHTGDVTPLRKVPGTPAVTGVSPVKKSPAAVDEGDFPVLEEVTTTLEIRDISPPKRMPRTLEKRDASPPKKQPESPNSQDVSPSRKAPTPPSKKDVSQPEKSGIVKESGMSSCTKVPEPQEKRDAFPLKEAPLVPGKRAVSPPKKMPGSLERKQEVLGTLEGREVSPSEKKFYAPSEEVSPRKSPETQGDRDVSMVRKSPESPHPRDMSPPKRAPAAREVFPPKRTPGGSEARDLSPPKREPGSPERRAVSPSKVISASPEGRGASTRQEASVTPETKDTVPSKHVPKVPEKRDVSPPKKTAGRPQERELSPGRTAAGTLETGDTLLSKKVSALLDKRDLSPPKTTSRVKEDRAASPLGEAIKGLEERGASPVQGAPGVPEGRDVPLPKHIPASLERRDMSPPKKTPVVLGDKHREAPKVPEGKAVSPSEKETVKLEGKGLPPVQVSSRPEGRDASPPKKAPGRDVSPAKKVPGTPEDKISPSKKVPGSPEKKEASPSRKIPGTAETTPFDTVPEESKNEILPEHRAHEQITSSDVSLTSKISETFEASVLVAGTQVAFDSPEGRDVSPSSKAPGQGEMFPSKELAGMPKIGDVSPLRKIPGKTESREVAPEQKSPALLKLRDTSPPKRAPGTPKSRDTSPLKQRAPETQEHGDVSPVKQAHETPERKYTAPEKKLPEMPEQKDTERKRKALGMPESKDVQPSVQQKVPERADSVGKSPPMQNVPAEPGLRHASPPGKVPDALEKKDWSTLEKTTRLDTRDVSPPKHKLPEVPEGTDASPSIKVHSKQKSREVSPSKEKTAVTGKSAETSPPKEQMPEATESRQHKFEVEVLEIPPGGWYLKDAIEQGLFDAKEGLFLIPGTDRLVSLEETLKMQILNPDSATVHEPGSKRTLTLTRALEKNLLSATGHYRDSKTKQTWTMEEAVKRKVVILLQRPDSAAPGHGPTRSIHVTRVVGQPDIVEVKSRELEAPKQDFPKFSDLQPEEILGDSERSLERAPGTDSTVASTLRGSTENEDAVVWETSTQKEIKLKDAVGKGVIDLSRNTYTDKSTGRSWKIDEAIKAGVLAVVGAPLILGAKAVGALRESATDERVHATATCSEPIRTTREVTKVVRHTSLHIRDATTGREVPLEEAVALGLISEDSARELQDGAKTTTEQSVHTTTTVLVTDPVTGETMTLAESLKQGCLDSETAAKLQRGNVTGVVTSVQTCLEGSGKGSTVAYQELLSAPREVASKHVEEARYAVPRFEVTLGRATSSQQPALQKVRRIVLSPAEAQSRGIADKDSVLDPQQGRWLPQSEAEAAGLLDAPTGDVLMPVGRPLSLPELVKQGLVEPLSQRIMHPETGALLTMEEAVLCDIANPMSAVPGPESPLTLKEALVSQVVDKESGAIIVAPGTSVTLIDAVQNMKVFDKLDTPRSVVPIPMLALTFPVALRHGVVNVTEGTYTHPVTKQKMPLEQAIKDGLLLPTPSVPMQDSLHVCEAVHQGLINQTTFNMRNPLTGEEVSIEDAMDSGILQLEPFDKTKFTSYGESTIRYISPVLHRTTVIRGTTIIIRPGYIMPQPGCIQNVDTGEVVSLDEAKERGIVQVQESVGKPTLFEALQQGLVDLERGLYIADGASVPISEAFSSNLIARDSAGSLHPGKYTLIQLFELYYDDDMHLFWVPGTNQPLSLDEVTQAGYLDLSTVLLDIDEGRVFTVQDGISSGYIDIENEKLRRRGREPLLILEAIKSGFLVAIDAPLLSMLPRRFGPVTDDETEEIKGCVSPSKQPSPQIQPTRITEAGGIIPAEESSVPKRPARKMRSESPGSKQTATSSPSPDKEVAPNFPPKEDKEPLPKSPDREILKSLTKEVVSRSPDREVKLKSPTKEIISRSPARDVIPRPSSKEASPIKEVAPKLPSKELSPSPTKEVVTKSPTKQTPPKSPPKEVSPRLSPKAPSPKSPPMEDSAKFPVKPLDWKAPAKMPPDHVDKTEGEISPTTEVSTFSSTEVVVKQTFTEYRKDYEAELVVGQKLPLRTLVQRDAMAPRNFLVFIPSSGRTMRLEDALATRQVTEDNIVMVRSMNELVVMDQVAPEFTLDSATSEGMYNTKLKTFTNPKTKKPISFAEFVARKFVDFSSVTVQDFKTKRMITLEEALERNIVDRETGQMVHPETKKPVSFFEASVLGWIVWETVVVTQTRQLTLAQAIRGLSFDQEKVTFCHPLLQGVSGLHEALCDCVIDPSSVLVYSREQDNVIRLTELPSYLGSLDSDCYIHPFTEKAISLNDAFVSGYLLSDSHALSIPVALERGMYDKSLKCFIHPGSQEQLNILQAVQQGIIDGFGTVVVDPESNTHIPLVRAIEIGVVNVNDCSVASLPLELAICQGLVADKSKCPSGDIRDPCSGRPVGLWSAVRAGLIDAERLRVRAGEGRLVSCAEAVRLGLLEGATGFWLGPPQLSADEALRWGFLLDSAIPMPLQNALALGLYCPGTGTLRRPGGRGQSLTVQDAVLEGILEPDVLTIKVAHSGEMLSLTEAVGAGLLDPVAGTVLDTECNITVDLYEGMGRGLVLPVAKVLPLLEIVLKSFYSPVTGLISSPFCERPQCLRDAVRSGFVSTGSTMVYSGNCLMPYLTAVDCGLMDDRAGVLRVLGGPMDLKLAFERCHLLDISPPLNVKMALSLGIFDDQSGHWMDPASGCLLTLSKALEERLLDDASTRVLQSKDDTRRTLVLSEALSLKKIDKSCSKYVADDGSFIPLMSCFKEGLLINVQPSTPLQRLIREGCYIETSNRFSIRGLSHTVSLAEVVMRRLIDPFLPFLPQPGQEPMHLVEACRMGLMELSLGLVRDGQQLVPLVRALETGLVIDLEKPLTLVEAVQLGFCDPDSGRLLHPVEGSYMNLEEALELGLVTTRDSYVKDAKTGQFLTFARAVESGVVDPVQNRYTPRDLNLYKAVFTKLIIYAKMPLSLGQAFADELFDEDTGKFLDPRSSELLGFKDALNCGLLDRCSMLQESASSAFSASRGTVISRNGPFLSSSTQAGSADSTSKQRSCIEIGNLQRGMKTSDRARIGVTSGFLHSTKQPIEPSMHGDVSFASRRELTSSKAQPAAEEVEKLKFPVQRQIVQETVLAAEMLPIIKAEQELQPCLSPLVKEQSPPSGYTAQLTSACLKGDAEPIVAVLAPSKSLFAPHVCVFENLTAPLFKKSAEIHDPTFASREVAVISPKTRQVRFHSMPSLQMTTFAALGIPLYAKPDSLGTTDPFFSWNMDNGSAATIPLFDSMKGEQETVTHQQKLSKPGQPGVLDLAGNGTDHKCEETGSSGTAENVLSPSQDDQQYSDKVQQPCTTQVFIKDTNDETAKDFDLSEPSKAVCKVAFHTEYNRASHATKVHASPSAQLAERGSAGKATRHRVRNHKQTLPDGSKDSSEEEYPLHPVELNRQEHSVVVHVEAADDWH